MKKILKHFHLNKQSQKRKLTYFYQRFGFVISALGTPGAVVCFHLNLRMFESASQKFVLTNFAVGNFAVRKFAVKRIRCKEISPQEF